MKKLLILLISLTTVLSGCTAAGLTQIKTQEAITKFENEETFVLYLGLSYCAACKIFQAIAEEVIKEDKITIFYVEYDSEKEDDLQELVLNHLQQVEPFPFSFPILYVVEDGKIIDTFSLVEADSERRFRDRMIKNGVIQP